MVKDHKKIAHYYYRNEDGIIVYKVESSEWFENETLKKSFQCYSKDSAGKWNSNFKNIEPVLYMLPSVIKGIKNNETIIYVEDEKSVDTLQNLGFTATTTFGGLRSFSKFSEKYAEQIKKANLIILPCNSNYSKEYSKAVYNNFKKSCKSVGIIQLPDLYESLSISDWINKGISKQQLEELLTDPSINYKNTNYNSPIYIEDGCYYKNYKDKQIFITNFIIKPKYIITSSYEELIKCELKVSNNGFLLIEIEL